MDLQNCVFNGLDNWSVPSVSGLIISRVQFDRLSIEMIFHFANWLSIGKMWL